MSEYGYTLNKIITLNDISGNDISGNDISGNGPLWYEYKGLGFLSSLKVTNENLVVIFHGCVKTNARNIFRGYNYVIEKTDVICVSNMLTNIYPDLRISWYLSSKNYDVHGLCIQLFQYLLDNKKYKNVIFTGSSGGAYPSMRYASIFNKTAIISNPQIYLETEYYNRFQKAQIILEEKGDYLLYKEEEIEHIIKNNKPKKIILYYNTLDVDQCSKFVNFMNKGHSDIFEFIPFKGPDILESGKTQHNYNFPENKSHLTILKEYISKMTIS